VDAVGETAIVPLTDERDPMPLMDPAVAFVEFHNSSEDWPLEIEEGDAVRVQVGSSDDVVVGEGRTDVVGVGADVV
jgi:hypothetical protein